MLLGVLYTLRDTDGLGCLWMNGYLCQGANKPNPDLSMVECDEPTKSNTIWTFGSSSGGVVVCVRGKRLLDLVKINWPNICLLPLLKLQFV